MIFKQVNEVPKMKRADRHDLKGMLKEFVEGNKKAVKVQLMEGEYKTPFIAYKSLYEAVKRHRYPVLVTWRNGEVYLEQK
jgi:hypothetical protein